MTQSQAGQGLGFRVKGRQGDGGRPATSSALAAGIMLHEAFNERQGAGHSGAASSAQWLMHGMLPRQMP